MTDTGARGGPSLDVRRRAGRPRLPVPPTLVVAGTALWGTVGTAQALGPAASTPLQVASLRGATGSAALLLVVGLSGQADALSGLFARRVAPWTLLAVLGITGFQAFFFTAVDMAGVAVGTLVAIGSSPIVAGLGDTLTGRRPGRRWLLGTIVTIAGAVLLLLPGEVTAGVVRVSPVGVLVAVAAGASYATYAMATTRVLERGGASLPLVAVVFGGSTVLLGPALAGADLGWVTTTPGVAMIAWLGLVSVGVGYPLFNAGLRHVGAASATTLGLTEPLTAALLAVAVLGERLTGPGLAGAALVAAGLAIVSLRPPTRVRDPSP